MRVLLFSALFSVFTLLCAFSSQVNAQGQGALGIALAQGYDYPYISHINPFGAGAASGLNVGDQIKEIGPVSVWYKFQAEAFLKNRNADKPFTMVIERNGTLHSLNIDARRPMRKWLNIDVQGNEAKCFFAPSAECIKSYIKPSSDADVEKRFGSYYSSVKTLSLLGKEGEATALVVQMETSFYDLPQFFTFNIGTLLETMAFVDRKPSNALVQFIQRKIRNDISDYLDVALTFEKYGHEREGRIFLDKAFALIAKDPSKLRYNARAFGSALAAYDEYDRLGQYAGSSEYKPDWAYSLLEAAAIHHAKKGDHQSSGRVLNIIAQTKRGWTNQDYVRFVGLFTRLHKPKLAMRFLGVLEGGYKKHENNAIAQTLYAGALVRAYAAVGDVHKAMIYLKKHYKNSVPMRIDLLIEATGSKSSDGIAVQFYKDLPPLIEETHRLYLALSNKEKKKIASTSVQKFYVILAAYLKINPDYRDLTGQDMSKFGYEKVIDAQIEVRNHAQALQWTDHVQQKFGKTYKYGKIFSSLGSSGSSQAIDALSRHPKFKEYRQRFLRNHMYRLFWNGRVRDASGYFNSLSDDEKVGAIKRQAYFVRICNECDL